jgi:two-component system, cell cycle sensor histidine kinase and response regulator CckA
MARDPSETDTALIDAVILDVVRSAPAALFQFKILRSGVYVMPFVSPGFSARYGLRGRTPDETAALLFSRIHASDAPAVKKALTHSASTLEDLKIEFRFTLPSGEIAWLEARAYARRTPEGDVVLNGVANNITARKAAEAAVSHRESHFRSVLDALQDSYFQTDLEGRFIQLSPSAAKMCGYSSVDELVGQLTTILYADPRDRDRLLEAVRKKGFVGDRVGQGRRKDGSTFWASVNAQVWFDERGQFAGVEGVVRDITQRMAASQALAASEARYRALFQNAAEGIIAIDANTREFLFFNPALCRMFGYSPEEFRNLTCDDIHPPEAHKEVLEEIRSMAGGVARVSPGMPCVRKDGTNFAADAHGSLVELDGRKMILGFFTDTTERVRLEDRLRQSQKIEAIGKLAGGVAHSFNNALMVVTANTDFLLADTPATDPKWERLTDIRSAAERAASLTDQLLAFGRKKMLQPQIVDVHTILRGLEVMLRRLIGDDIEVLTEFDAASSWTKVDPGQLEQVVMNLALNARDAMPRGGRITIRTRSVGASEPSGVDESGELYLRPRLILSVSDTGAGIPPDVKARLFEPFFTTKEFGSGAGLGLATVFGIVKQSGGEIVVESGRGKGSTFSLLFPSEPMPGAGANPREPSSSLPRGTETILVAEDEDNVRRVVKSALDSAGYRVLEARSAAKALELASNHEEGIDLLVTDVVMPGMNGRELADSLKRQRPNIRILYMSGYSDDIVMRHGVGESTRVAFLQKPFSMTILAQRVREILDESR